jgi:hypothetical protein
MKMLFFSSEGREVEQVRAELLAAGIACEVRRNSAGGGAPEGGDVELWIENDGDAHRAAMVCVERGVGFAKRPPVVGIPEEETQEC